MLTCALANLTEVEVSEATNLVAWSRVKFRPNTSNTSTPADLSAVGLTTEPSAVILARSAVLVTRRVKEVSELTKPPVVTTTRSIAKPLLTKVCTWLTDGDSEAVMPIWVMPACCQVVASDASSTKSAAVETPMPTPEKSTPLLDRNCASERVSHRGPVNVW